MTTRSEAQLEVARTFGMLTASREGRAYLAANEYVSGTPVIAAQYEDTIDDVLRRVGRCRRSAVVAILRDGELEAITLTPGREGGEETSDVSRHSCIGMLIDAVKRSERRERFRFTDTKLGTVAFARPLEVAIPA